MLPGGSRVLVVGGEGLIDALVERGLVPVAELADRPAAVVQGFHPDVGWRLLAEGAYAIATGLPWVVSNLDRTIPTPRGEAPGNGAFVEVLKLTTGRTPVVAGKPEPPMHREAVLRTGAKRPLVVGDRLDTDIEGARRAGAESLLVLTGVADPEELVGAPAGRRPTYVGEDLRALLAAPGDVGLSEGAIRNGAWAAAVEDGRMSIERIGDQASRLDALRAMCGAAWAAGERPHGVADALVEAGW
jgi:ribonucleotide monophosphatase NagD (HAD superfamily)